METLYRKVSAVYRLPKKSGTYFSNKGEVYYRESTKRFEHNYDKYRMYPEWWLEEIPDNSRQIEKLEADKEELLVFIETYYRCLDLEYQKEAKSLIKKHKK